MTHLARVRLSECFLVIHLGGEKVEHLARLGIFFAGLGIFLASMGFFWWCSLYAKKIKIPK